MYAGHLRLVILEIPLHAHGQECGHIGILGKTIKGLT